MTGDGYLQSQNTGGAGSGTTNNYFDSMTAFRVPGVSGNYGDYINYNFKRASGFFDIVFHEGTGSTLNVSHNLELLPNLLSAKDLTAILIVIVLCDLTKGINLRVATLNMLLV